jgi:hypothetical protein
MKKITTNKYAQEIEYEVEDYDNTWSYPPAANWTVNQWIESMFTVPGKPTDPPMSEQIKQKIMRIVGEEAFNISDLLSMYKGTVVEGFETVIKQFANYFESNDMASTILAKKVHENFYDPQNETWGIDAAKKLYNVSPSTLKSALEKYYPDFGGDDNSGDGGWNDNPMGDVPSNGVEVPVYAKVYFNLIKEASRKLI